MHRFLVWIVLVLAFEAPLSAPVNFDHWAEAIFADLGEWDFEKRAAGIEARALIVQGQNDLIVPPAGAERWARAMSRARLVRVDQAGHVPWYEKPERIFGLVSRFLEGEWPAAAVSIPDEAP